MKCQHYRAAFELLETKIVMEVWEISRRTATPWIMTCTYYWCWLVGTFRSDKSRCLYYCQLVPDFQICETKTVISSSLITLFLILCQYWAPLKRFLWCTCKCTLQKLFAHLWNNLRFLMSKEVRSTYFLNRVHFK